MWIRSQDRYALLNVNQVLISPSVDGSIYYINDSLGEESNVLGVYTGEEKALKVLDQIQTCIMNEHHYHTDDENCTRRFFTKEWKEIYEMPQDDEVEV